MNLVISFQLRNFFLASRRCSLVVPKLCAMAYWYMARCSYVRHKMFIQNQNKRIDTPHLQPDI